LQGGSPVQAAEASLAWCAQEDSTLGAKKTLKNAFKRRLNKCHLLELSLFYTEMVINLLRQPRDKHKESALQQMLACFRTVNSYTLSMQETKCERAEVIQVIPADIKVALDLDDYITGLGQKQSERDDEDEVRQRPFFPLFQLP